MDHVTPRNTLLPVGATFNNDMSPRTDSEKKEMDDKPYRSILSSVMWGQLATRPDLSFSVSLLARFQANPGIEHWKTLMHVIGYIRNTLDYGLTYSRNCDLSPIAYVDADYGACTDTRRSTSGYVFMMSVRVKSGEVGTELRNTLGGRKTQESGNAEGAGKRKCGRSGNAESVGKRKSGM